MTEATCVCGHEADEHWTSNACAVQDCPCNYYEPCAPPHRLPWCPICRTFECRSHLFDSLPKPYVRLPPELHDAVKVRAQQDERTSPDVPDGGKPEEES